MKIKFSGNLRKEFKKSADSKVDKRLDALVVVLQDATPVRTGEARDGWHREGRSIINRVDHIEYLNTGSSQQAPAHFIEKELLAQKDLHLSGTIVRSL
jgi:hypothetical protein